MGIIESSFDKEIELQEWAFEHINQFLGDCVRLDGFQIQTPSGKKGIPDGFAFNFGSNEWFLLECELLRHGVWPHIAEQITRFVVALQSKDTLRTIRDRLFDRILASGAAEAVASTFEVEVSRLLKQIELFIESIQPNVVVFIDDTNQDLNDFAHALDITTQIYRIKKFIVNGSAEYYSPDQDAPIITTTPDEKAIGGKQDFDVIEKLGGVNEIVGDGRVKCYKLEDGRVVYIKRSKFHEKNNYYWYGINPSSLEQIQEMGATHFVFVLGDWGFTLVPVKTVVEYCQHTKATKNPDGSIRHYHALISPEPEPEMYWSKDTPRYSLTEQCETF